MNAKTKKITAILSVIILVAGISFTVFAITGGKKPSVQSGEFENLIADRIELTVKNTDFVLTKSTDEAETFTVTCFFTAKKTQADFYAVIDNFEFTSLSYDNIVFTALNEKTEDKTVNGLTLTASDAQPDLYEWQVDITLSVLGKGVYKSALKIDYTSGMTQQTAQSKTVEIPLTITVE